MSNMLCSLTNAMKNLWNRYHTEKKNGISKRTPEGRCERMSDMMTEEDRKRLDEWWDEIEKSPCPY